MNRAQEILQKCCKEALRLAWVSHVSFDRNTKDNLGTYIFGDGSRLRFNFPLFCDPDENVGTLREMCDPHVGVLKMNIAQKIVQTYNDYMKNSRSTEWTYERCEAYSAAKFLAEKYKFDYRINPSNVTTSYLFEDGSKLRCHHINDTIEEIENGH